MSCIAQWKPVVAMVTVSFALGMVNVLLKKMVTEGLSQLVIVTYRQVVSALFLIPVAYFFERNSRAKLTAHIVCQLFFSALIGFTLTQYFFIIGLKNTSATFTCAFINLVPVNTFVLALPLGLEKVNIKNISGKAKVIGTMASVGGALLLVFYKGMPLINQPVVQHIETQKHNSKRWVIGSVVLTVGSLGWSSWFIIQARIGKTFPFKYSSTAILSSLSAIQSAVLSLVIEKNISASNWMLKGKMEIAGIIYAGMVGSGLCYVAMSWCVEQRGPVFTSAFSPLIQIFVAIFDVSMLHEQIHLGSVLGSILVIFGLYILLWGKGYEADVSMTKHTCTEEAGEGECNQLPKIRPVNITTQNTT